MHASNSSSETLGTLAGFCSLSHSSTRVRSKREACGTIGDKDDAAVVETREHCGVDKERE